MYSTLEPGFTKEFETISQLTEYIIRNGNDPNYEITEDGEGIGETAWDFIVP